MSGLTLVKNKGQDNPLPNKEALEKAVEVVVAGSSVEAAEYLRDEFAARLKETKMVEQGVEVMKKLQEIVDWIKLKVEKGPIWEGDNSMPTGYQNYQKSLAADAAAMINDMLVEGPVTYTYAVSDESNLARGYTVGNNNDPELDTVSALDDLFNAWLAKNNMMSQDGVIYDISNDGTVQHEQDDNGQIMKDDNGNPIAKKTDPEQLRQKISDLKEGFAQYVKTQNNKIQLSVNYDGQHFPSKTVEAERGASAAGG